MKWAEFKEKQKQQMMSSLEKFKQSSGSMIPMGSPSIFKQGQAVVDMKKDRGRKPH